MNNPKDLGQIVSQKCAWRSSWKKEVGAERLIKEGSNGTNDELCGNEVDPPMKDGEGNMLTH